MSIKINSPLPGVPGLPEPAHSGAGAAARRPSAAAGTQVEISALSARLQELGAMAASEATVDAKRVAELQQAIREGRFQVNPERIADGVLREARQLLGRRQAQQ